MKIYLISEYETNRGEKRNIKTYRKMEKAVEEAKKLADKKIMNCEDFMKVKYNRYTNGYDVVVVDRCTGEEDWEWPEYRYTVTEMDLV